MNDILKNAMARIIAERCAEGRAVFDAPAELARMEPCPKCKATVETAPVTFEVSMGINELLGLSPRPDEYPARGLIVCHACLTPLMFTQSSALEVVPKKVLRRLPEISRRFIARHQEMYRQVKRGTH